MVFPFSKQGKSDVIPGKVSLLAFSGPIETVSDLPGRIRFRSAALAGDSLAKASIEESLCRIPGVISIEANSLSGSVLIQYEPEAISADILFVALLKILDLEDEFLRTPVSALGRVLGELGTSFDRAVYEITGGITDLRTAILVALIVGGISKIARNATLGVPGGFTLLWWAGTKLFSSRGRGAR